MAQGSGWKLEHGKGRNEEHIVPDMVSIYPCSNFLASGVGYNRKSC